MAHASMNAFFNLPNPKLNAILPIDQVAIVERVMTRHQGRHFLQIPGPSPVPDRVLRAMDMPVIDHRSAEFAELGKAVLQGCQKIFKTSGSVIIFPSSGTGAWE